MIQQNLNTMSQNLNNVNNNEMTNELTFENWNNLTKDQKIELKKRAFERANRIAAKSITNSSSESESDSESVPDAVSVSMRLKGTRGM